MKNFTFILLYFFINTSDARVNSVDRRGEQIFLSTDTCEEAKRQVELLAAWGPNKACAAVLKEKTIPMVGTISCEVNITSCLPDHVRKYHGVNPDIHGPNCWNLSLVMAGILPNLRYSTPEEMDFFMNPPLCKKLQNQEKRRAGDIGAIRRRRGEEVHGFIYISDQLTYSKNGYSKRSPYALQTLKGVYEKYGIGGQDKKCLSNRMDSSCDKGVEYYRCISMNEYLEKEKEGNSMRHGVLPFVNKVECLTSGIAFEEKILEKQSLNTMIVTIKALNMYIDDELKGRKPASLGERDIFIMASTKLRLEAISQQLILMADSRAFFDNNVGSEMKQLISLLSKSRKELTEVSND